MNNRKGSVYQRKDGKWVGAIMIDGKRKVVYGSNEAEATSKLNKLKDNLVASPIPITNKVLEDNIKLRNKLLKIEVEESSKAIGQGSPMHLDDWLKEWLNKYKSIRIRQSTYVSYEGYIRNHVGKHYIKSCPLRDLNIDAMQDFYNYLNKKGLSAKTIRNIHNMLYESLNLAISKEFIKNNPTINVEKPKVKKKEAKFLTKEEQIKLLQAIRSSEYRYKTLYELALGTGLRLGELIGLRWDAIDLNKGVLKVNQSLRRVKINFDEDSSRPKTEVRKEDPKTDNGFRKVPIPKSVIHELILHKSRECVLNKDKPKSWNKDRLVFISDKGNPVDARVVQKGLEKLTEIASIKYINFHALRHTYATRLFEEGIQAKIIQELLGHYSVQLTLDTYSHVVPSLKDGAVETLEKLFNNNYRFDKVVNIENFKEINNN